MTRRAAFGLRARRDVGKAFEWYEHQRPGLGLEFETALNETIELLRGTPELGRVVHGNIRRFPVRRFPYAVFYRLTDSRIAIRACIHERRNARVRERLRQYLSGLGRPYRHEHKINCDTAAFRVLPFNDGNDSDHHPSK